MKTIRLVSKNKTGHLSRLLKCFPEETKIINMNEIPGSSLLEIKLTHESFTDTADGISSGFIKEIDGKLVISTNNGDFKEV